jgi:hypothetical protein
VGSINTLPLDKGPTAGFRIEGRPLLTPDKWPGGNYRTVSTEYFRAMNIPMAQGRPFSERDIETAPRVMVINQALAARDFPNENPIGKRITFGNKDAQGQPVWWEIVGVAANVRSLELREEATPEFYLPALQDSFTNMFLVVRTSANQQVWLPLYDVPQQKWTSRQQCPTSGPWKGLWMRRSRSRASIWCSSVYLAALLCCCRPPVFTESRRTASRSELMSLAFAWRLARKSAMY